MNIRLATDADQTAWDTYVLNHPDGLAYHQYGWKKSVERAYGFAGIYLVAEQKGVICGVLPMVDFKLPFVGRSYISLPYCDVGGVLANEAEIGTRLISESNKMAEKAGAKGLELRFGTKGLEEVGSENAPKVRMVLDLPENSAVLLASLKSKLRSQVNKPIRDGLTAALGGLELFDQFYQVFCENMRELGSPVHSRKWFQSILLDYGDHARVGIVYTPDGMPASAGIILLHAKTASIPWASSLRRLNRLNPNMLLYWNFLSFAADNGFEKFDFGRSTPGEGTYKFKKQWGAESVPLFWNELIREKDNQAPALRQSLIRQQVEKMWCRMPLWFCNSLGPRVRRYVNL